VVLVVAALGWSLGCGAGESGPITDPGPGPEAYPGACVCYDGSFSFRSCVVTENLAACRSAVTTCNPFFFTNADCTRWCPSSPQHCP
jgi:hypothetical protein